MYSIILPHLKQRRKISFDISPLLYVLYQPIISMDMDNDSKLRFFQCKLKCEVSHGKSRDRLIAFLKVHPTFGEVYSGSDTRHPEAGFCNPIHSTIFEISKMERF